MISYSYRSLEASGTTRSSWTRGATPTLTPSTSRGVFRNKVGKGRGGIQGLFGKIKTILGKGKHFFALIEFCNLTVDNGLQKFHRDFLYFPLFWLGEDVMTTPPPPPSIPLEHASVYIQTKTWLISPRLAPDQPLCLQFYFATAASDTSNLQLRRQFANGTMGDLWGVQAHHK